MSQSPHKSKSVQLLLVFLSFPQLVLDFIKQQQVAIKDSQLVLKWSKSVKCSRRVFLT